MAFRYAYSTVFGKKSISNYNQLFNN